MGILFGPKISLVIDTASEFVKEGGDSTTPSTFYGAPIIGTVLGSISKKLDINFDEVLDKAEKLKE